MLKEHGFTHIFALLITLLSIILVVYLVQNPQIFKSNAALDKTRLEFVDDKGNVITQTLSPKVRVRLTYIPQPSISPSPTPSPKPSPSVSNQPPAQCLKDSDCQTGQTCSHRGVFCSRACAQGGPCPPPCYGRCVGVPLPSPSPVSCTQCIINNRADLLPFYKQNGWDTSQSNWNNIVNNWCQKVSSEAAAQCSALKQGVCAPNCSGPVVAPKQSLNLVPTAYALTSQGTEFGMQIDEQDSKKVPNSDQFNLLHPAWLRFVYRPDKGLLNLPTQVKQLVIFNNESASPAPIGSTDINTWKNYTDSVYIPKLKELLSKYPKLDAIEIWNEEDICPSSSFCPRVPPAGYAYLIKQATTIIKAANGSIKVVLGGLASGQTSYLIQVLTSTPLQLDAIGIHPYGQSPDGALQNILSQYQTVAGSMPIWVSEVGLGSNDQNAQADYLTKSFKVYSQYGIPVVIWYAWVDTMTGGDGGNNYGLMDSNYNLKLSGKAFIQFSQGSTAAAYPTSFRLSNDKASLEKAPGQSFDQNPKIVSWELTPGNGLKTVYVQFKVNGSWNEPLSQSIILKIPPAPLSKFDLNGDGKVNQDDINIFLGIWRSGKYSQVADFNGDGKINILDYILIIRAAHPK